MNIKTSSLFLASVIALATVAPSFAATPAAAPAKTTKACASKKVSKLKTTSKKAAIAPVKKAK